MRGDEDVDVVIHYNIPSQLKSLLIEMLDG